MNNVNGRAARVTRNWAAWQLKAHEAARDRRRLAYTLKHVEGRTLAEVGAALGVSRQRAHAMVKRAIEWDGVRGES